MSVIKTIRVKDAATGVVSAADIGANAGNVSYDNTLSGLSATELQDAIDELAAGGGGGTSPVASVNGKTGVVVLNADDIGDTNTTNKWFSGSYNDLTNKPTIPSALSELTDDSTHRLVTDAQINSWNSGTGGGAVDSVNGQTGTVVLDADDIDDTNTVNKWFSGSYNDLTDKPTIPTALSDLTDDSTHRLVTDAQIATWNAGGGGSSATVLSQTLAAGSTTVTFTNIPTTGDYFIDFFTSNGSNYIYLNTSTPGQVTLTFEAQPSAITVFCKIEEVSL